MAVIDREWLTMIYLGADNDLFEFGDRLLKEAQNVGSNDTVTVVAQRDPTDPKESSLRGKIVRRKWEAKDIGPTNNGAGAVVNFARDSMKEYPAAKTMLLLWDHGNGWQNVHVFEQVVDIHQRLLAIDLSEALSRAGIDVLCFDACLMAMIEIAYQLRGRVKYMVASENVVPADSGWPYDSILCTLQSRPDMTPQLLARALVHMFSGAYNGSTAPVTLSALDLTYVADVVDAISKLSLRLMAACRAGMTQDIILARRHAQSFGNPDYIDLTSFCIELELLFANHPVEVASKEVREKMRNLVIASAHGCTPSIAGAHGLSIYFPDRPMSPRYEELDFARDCAWTPFLSMVTPPNQPEGRLDPESLPAASPETVQPRPGHGRRRQHSRRAPKKTGTGKR